MSETNFTSKPEFISRCVPLYRFLLEYEEGQHLLLKVDDTDEDELFNVMDYINREVELKLLDTPEGYIDINFIDVEKYGKSCDLMERLIWDSNKSKRGIWNLMNVSNENNDVWDWLCDNLLEKNPNFPRFTLVVLEKNVNLAKISKSFSKKPFIPIGLKTGERLDLNKFSTKLISISKPETEEKSIDNIFCKEDAIWIIQYKDESFKLNDIIGLKFMVYLLKNKAPNSFSPKQLYQQVNGLKKSNMNTGRAYSAGLTISDQDDPGDIVDEDTKKLINKLKLKKEIAEETGNDDKIQDINQKIYDLEREYLPKLRSLGKSIKFPSATYKGLYDKINNNINTVLKNIEKYSNEKGYDSMLTYNHLKYSIQFKNSLFSYTPKEPTDWQF